MPASVSSSPMSSSSRTLVAEAAGAKTQLTGVVGAVAVALLLVFAPDLLRNLPTSAKYQAPDGRVFNHCDADWLEAQVQALPLVAFEAGSGTRDLIDRWFRSAGLAVTPVMQLGSIEAIKRMVRAGLGYSIVPRMAVEQAEDRYGLTVHSLAPSLYRQLAVVMRQDKVITKGMAEMLRLLQAVRL